MQTSMDRMILGALEARGQKWHRHLADAAWAGSPCHAEPGLQAGSGRVNLVCVIASREAATRLMSGRDRARALGATPKRSLSVSLRTRESTLKQVWACHPDRQFLRSGAKQSPTREVEIASSLRSS